MSNALFITDYLQEKTPQVAGRRISPSDLRHVLQTFGEVYPCFHNEPLFHILRRRYPSILSKPNDPKRPAEEMVDILMRDHGSTMIAYIDYRGPSLKSSQEDIIGGQVLIYLLFKEELPVLSEVPATEYAEYMSLFDSDKRSPILTAGWKYIDVERND